VGTASVTSRSESVIEVEGEVVDGGGYVIGRASGTYRLVTGFGDHGR
jgi:hypothetical protein